MAENRITQEAIESLEAGAASVRLTQEALEAIRAAAAHARMTQGAVEVLHSSVGSAAAGLTQLAIEVVVPTRYRNRVSVELV